MSMRVRQKAQHAHDLQHHFDIVSLSRHDRLKHYGLHFAKYAGRFARGAAEPKTRTETIVDAFLVALSAANALNQSLLDEEYLKVEEAPSILVFIDQAGRFADACEKIDHLEDYRVAALTANAALTSWIGRSALHDGLDVDALMNARRQKLAQRAVYALEV